MIIFVPSLNRSWLERPSFSWLPPEWKDRTFLAVHEREAKQYEPMVDQHHVGAVVLPDSVVGISAVRYELGKIAAGRGHNRFAMMDDDIDFYYRPDPLDYHLRVAPTDVVGNAMNAVAATLIDYAHVSISMREGQNRCPYDFAVNQRYCRFLAYQTEEFLKCTHERVKIMEDFDIALQLMSRGLPSKIWFLWAQGQKQTQMKGGCSTYRTREFHAAEVEKFAALHPGLVRTRMKSNKTDRDGFGTRLEVTIEWKKAIKAGAGWRASAYAQAAAQGYGPEEV